MIKKTLIALISAGLMTGCASESKSASEVSMEINTEEIVEEDEKDFKYQLPEASIQEQMALAAFQERGITDRLALAVLLGNVKHESQFKPDICEGGARVPYENCHTGGFGLIQWTTHNRYNGLGNFAKKYDCNPSTTECQLRYMFNEVQWQSIEKYMKTPGKTIEWYMEKAYIWLGWGVHGHRTDYAYDYARWLS